ncbi:MAG: hypothetical protein QG622_3725 [Actinomycetota bacterium]|nr:hypothetical protein [Actinomycetota bacterium]
MLELPRSVRLAAWGTAVLTGAVRTADAVRAVTGDDEPHDVVTAPEPGGTPGGTPGSPPGAGARDLGALLAEFAAGGVPGLRVVLPVPGDVAGLPGPPAFNLVALAAGECVLADAGPAVRSGPPGAGVVPEVTVFGSEREPGAFVTWSVHPVPSRVPAVYGSLGEAERELRAGLAEAVEALDHLDVARWREDAADRVAAVRDGVLAPSAFPPGAPGRCVRVVATAARIRAVVDLAVTDDGAALSSHEIRRRAGTLRVLDGVCRRAMVAAVAGLREPRRA